MGKKNKKKVTPAVGSPAAGGNNKREKNKSESKNSAAKTQKKAVRTSSADQKKAKPEKTKPEKVKKEKTEKVKTERLKKEKTEKVKTERPKKEKTEKVKTERPKKEKSEKIKTEKPKKEKAEKNKTQKSLKEKFEDFKRDYNIAKVAVAILLVIALIVGIISLIVSAAAEKLPDNIRNAEYKGRREPASVAFDLDISAEQQKKLAGAVKTKGSGPFDFFVNEEIVIDDYTDPVLLEFGSIEKNECDLVAFLIDEDGNIIYRSLGLEPGKQIRSVFFFDEVAYGTQTLTLAVNGYDRQTNKKTGTKTAHIKLKIGAENEEK